MSTYRPSRPRRHLLSFLLLMALLVSLVMPALAARLSSPKSQEGAPPDQAGAGQPLLCAPLNEAEQQEFDSLTTMKAAETLAGADLARYEALAQQLNCYNAQFAAPVQSNQPIGARRETPTVTATVGGGGSGTYATLKAAFDDINIGAGGLTGPIQLNIVGDTTETAPAVLNASGGSASYTSVLIQPAGGVGRTISGAITAGSPLIDLNGADNVTIDGLNTGGNSLTIANTTASATSGTSTIRFINGATNNTITNATISGSFNAAVGTNGGNIFFSTDANTANGNDNNNISNNNIGPAGANLPTKGVYSNGTTTTAALFNSGNVITGNNIFDYFGAAVTSAGVYLAAGTTDFTVSNNKFYQTATRTQTTGAQHSAIWIEGTSGNNHQITGNTIGFASSTGTGTYTFVGVSSSVLVPIFLNVGTTTATSVQGNTIAGIAMSGAVSGTSSSAAFRGIYVSSGLTTVGDVTGNTIGSQSTTGSISYTSSSTSASDVIAMFNFGSSNWTVSNNTIGGITAANSSTGASNVYGIRVFTASGVTFVCQNNTIGGTVANSIQSTSTATGTTVQGILNSSPIGTITGNQIRNLTAAGGTGTTTSASVIGISVTASANQTIGQNTLQTLSNTNATAASVVTGIQFTGGAANVVERNRIYGLTASTTSASAEVNGIRVGGGTTIYRNNMIALGAGIANALGATATNSSTAGIVGINEALGTDQFFHNSVYIGGTATAGAGSSFAFNGTQTVNTRSFRDNIFFNARTNSGATGKHYAVKINGTAPNPTGLTINNNVYLANGTGGVFGFFNSLDVANLTAWKTAVGQDGASFEANPQYNDPTNAVPDLHLHPTNPTVAEGNGVDVGVINDYDGQTRSTLTPVDIGADAGNFIGIDLTAPVITYTALANTTSTANRSFSNVTITDASGVNTTSGTRPRVYYKRSTDTNAWNDNTSGTNGWKWVEANGATSPFDFTLDYSLLNGGTGVSAGTTVQYFVVAQDLAATPNVSINSGTFAATPSSVALTAAAFPIGGTINSYLISVAFSGAYTVPGSYASLTNAGGIFEALNAGVLTGNVVINITADLSGELGTNALNQWAEDGVGGYTMLIKPSGAPRVVTGTNAGALIRLNGADRVRIDGSTAATVAGDAGGTPGLRELTIQNTNTGTSAVVISVQSGTNGAQNDTIKNVNVHGQDPTTTLAGITLGGNTPGTAGTDNDGNRIENCSVKRAIYGIYSSGASAANPNLGTVLTQNDLSATTTDRIRRIGIVVFNEDGIQITENSVGGLDTNESADAIGIGVGTQAVDATNTTSGGVTNAFVSRNKVNGVKQTTTYSAAGITVSGAIGANTVSNNMITGVTSDATSPDLVAGIYVVGATGSSTQLYYNSVSMTGDRSAVTAGQMPSYGLAVTGTDPAVVAKDNIFYTTQIASAGGVNAKSYAIGMVTTTFANLDSNYNDFWSTGANDGGFRSGSLSTAAGTDYATLALWQAAVADDANSIEADPLFVSSTDLHISTATVSPVANAGTPIAGVAADYDAETRNAGYPDIGADEFSVSAALPAGTYQTRAVNSGETWTLGGNVTLNGGLALNGGLVVVGANTLTFGPSATVLGMPSASSMIIADGTGSACKTYSAAGSFTFPIGDNTAGADYSPATISYTAGSFPGNACVRVTDAAHPNLPGAAASYVTRYWTATGTVASPTYNATFTYTAGDIVGTESSMSGKKWDGAIPWTTLGAASGNQFVGAGLTNFSDFTAFDTPLAAVLADFSAAPNGNAIRVTWETVSEVGNIGFNLWRGDAPSAPDTQLNSALIPSQAPGSSQGFVYTFDDANVVSGSTYYYWVETVDTQGGVSRFGPVSATFNAPTAVRLSAFDVAPMAPFALPAAGAALLALAAWAARRRR